MNVLVLDGDENQAVASVRSLARAGHKVWVGSPSAKSKAGWSRYCSGSLHYRDPKSGSEAFLADVLQALAIHAPALVFPMTERTTLPLSTARQEIVRAGGTMVLPDHKDLLRAFDKSEVMRLAQKLGIAVPKSSLVANADEAGRLASSVQYPVVLKPVSSNQLRPDGSLSPTGAPRYARTPAEMLAAYSDLRRVCSSVLLQEFVEGTGSGYFALMRNGVVSAEFAHQRLRDVRPTGSGSSLRISVPLDPRVRAAGSAILTALNWHGVAMVEFRIRQDGTPVLLEVNGRFWNSLALAIYAGADFPNWLAKMAVEGSVPSDTEYQTGVRCRWFLGDTRHLIEVLLGAPREFPGQFPGRVRSVLEFFKIYPGTYHDNFEARDPLPELADWLYFFFRKVPGLWSRSEARSTPLLHPESTPGAATASPRKLS